jgi:hypothetical protein
MTLTIDLQDDELRLLNAKADAAGLSAAEWASRLLRQALAPPRAERPLASRIREIWADMPDEVRPKLPSDGASQHDHYIYGAPKREE